MLLNKSIINTMEPSIMEQNIIQQIPTTKQKKTSRKVYVLIAGLTVGFLSGFVSGLLFSSKTISQKVDINVSHEHTYTHNLGKYM